MENPESRRLPVGVVATLSAIVVAAGGGTAWWAVNSQNTAPSNSGTPTTVQSTVETPLVGGTKNPSPETPVVNGSEQQVQIYLLKDTGTQFQLTPMPVSVKASQQPSEVLTAAFESLLAEPKDAAAFSEIPAGTQVLSAEVKDKGVYVDLSSEFTSGGGSTSMSARLGQVVYTATSLDPNALVWISVGGEPLEILGGEGLEVPQPITRQIFEAEFPL